ncbi:MAG: porin family protein [Prevotella sp.]
MKKMMTTALFICAMLLSTTATAQVKLGVKGGLNVTNMSLSSDVLDASNQTGFFVGPTLKITLPIVGLGIDASALYDQREAKLKAAGDEQAEATARQKSIQIPLNLRYGMGLGSLANVFVFAGPQFGFNVGDKNQDLYGVDWKLKSSNFSVNVGLGVTLLTHLQVSANYNIACGKTGELKWDDSVKGVTGKNNAWQIAAAYYF